MREVARAFTGWGQMMILALQGEGQDAMRILARRYYVEVLRPDQVVDWVLGIEEK